MKTPPNISEATLIRAIQQGYGLEINQLDFLLRGFGGDCYRAEAHTGVNYFLKLHDSIANQMTAASSRDFYLPLMHQLHTQGILPHIPQPQVTITGRFSLTLEQNELVITSFIEGQLVGFGALSVPVLAQLAEAVGLLHRSLVQLEFEHPFADQFKIVFEQELLNSFEVLAALPADATPGQQELRDIILPRKSQLIAGLDRLRDSQTYAQGTRKPQVICHTDLHGGNLITGPDGALYILDWENALIAPPEHDLFFFVDEPGFWDVFWPRYTSRFSEASLDPEILRFYFYRRALEDIADFIFRILRRREDPVRDQEDLGWMLDCLKGLPQIDETVSRVSARL